MSFAEGTSVPIERSKAEIESMLIRYGAEQFVSGWGESEARIQFRAKGRIVRFCLPIPAKGEKRFTQHPRYASKRRTEAEAMKAWEAELRRLWRALALVVKRNWRRCRVASSGSKMSSWRISCCLTERRWRSMPGP